MHGEGARGARKTVFHNALRIKTNKFDIKMWHLKAISVNLVFLFKHIYIFLLIHSFIHFAQTICFTQAKAGVYFNFNVIYGMKIIVIAYFIQVVNLSLSLTS